MRDDNETLAPLELMPSGVVEAQERAQIDTQIATAKRYPRNVAQVRTKMLSIATLDEATAAACFYTLPRGGKTVQGPSVRLAEIAVSAYGNIRAATRILSVHTGENPHATVQAVCHDLEGNVFFSVEKRRRITTKKNRDGTRRPVDDDDIQLAVNAGSAIAFRDAVFKVVPGALVKPVLEQAMKVAVGDVKSLGKKRDQVLSRLKQMGVLEAQILSAVGVAKVEEIDADKLSELIGIGTALKDGNITLEEAFPPVAPAVSKTVFRKPDPVVETTPTPAPEPSTPPPSVGDEAPHAAPVEAQEHRDLFAIITGAGATFDTFLAWAIAEGYPGAADWTCIADVPVETAGKLAKAGKGLAAALKGGAR